jgi:uracil-DNA glycosylase family 4
VALSLRLLWPGITRHRVFVEPGLSSVQINTQQHLDPSEKYITLNYRFGARAVSMISKDFEKKDGHPAGPLTAQSAPAWVLWHHHTLGITQGIVLPQAQTSKTDESMDEKDSPLSSSVHVALQDPMVFATRETTVTSSEKKGLPKANLSETPSPQEACSLGVTSPQSGPEKEAALWNLSQYMKEFRDLPIAQSAENMVFSDGNPHSAIMLVGEAPGAEEDRQGKPFVGASGKLLDAMLASIGLDRTQVYIANVVAWRPPFNRQPSGQEIGVCLPFLHQHIHIIQPRVIICVGGVAAKALLQLDQTLTQTQGHKLTYRNPEKSLEIPAFTLYHPAYLMRAPGQKKVAWHQLLYIQGFLQTIGVLARPTENTPKPADLTVAD